MRANLRSSAGGFGRSRCHCTDIRSLLAGGAKGGHNSIRNCARLRVRLLQGDRGAGLFEDVLGLVGGLLVRALEHGGGGAVNEGLRLTETEVREGAHLLDDLDLLVAGRLDDDVEGILLLDLLSGGTGATRGGRGSGSGDR